MELRLDKFKIIILFSLLLYLQMAWVPGFFHDGYLYAAFGKNAAELGYWLVPYLNQAVYAEFFHHPPLIFDLEGLFFKIFGASYVTARIFSFSFVLATLFIIFKWVGDVFGKRRGFLAAILFLVIPPLLKKSRFPNLDIPLMLFILSSLYFYWKALNYKDFKYWFLTGLFFGLGMLCKGPLGFFPPVIIILHMAWERKFASLKDWRPWLGLLFGFLLFLIWPLLLYINGKFYVFTQYLDFTFFQTIKNSRGGQDSSFATYFLFLLKNTGPLFLLFLWGSFLEFKEKRSSGLMRLFVVASWAHLILLSVPSFKYSNYLIPMYPYYAIVMIIPFMKTRDHRIDRANNFLGGLIVLVGITLLVFPVTNKIKRDPEIFKTMSILNTSKDKNISWFLIDEIYPFWSLNNLLSWHQLGLVVRGDEDLLQNIKTKKSVYILPEKYLAKVGFSSFEKVFYSRKKHFYILVSKDLLKTHSFFED